MTELTLGFGLAFTDLYENAGLEKLDRRFVAWLREADGDLAAGCWTRGRSRRRWPPLAARAGC